MKLTKALMSDSMRTIERTRSRFISIIGIVALGISFFAGMGATAPDMLDTARDYYASSNAMDMQIISTAGLTDDDVNVIKSIQGIENVTGEKFIDGVLKINGESSSDIDGSEMTVRAISLDINKAAYASSGTDDSSFMNRPELLEGSWPSQPNQCLVDSSTLSTPDEFQIGAVISIEGDSTDISGSLKNSEYTIVGVIRTPLYVSYERGNTNIGTGKLGTFIYVPSDNFLTDYYSSISIKIAGSDDYDPYSKEYAALIQPYMTYISSIASERLSSRVETLKAQYTQEVEKGEAEYAKTKSDIEDSLAQAKEQMEKVLDMAENGDKVLAEYKAKYNEKATEASQTVDSSKLEHTTQYAAWEEKKAKYDDAKALVEKYSGADMALSTAQTEYNVANLEVNSMLSTVEYLEDLCATTRSAMDYLDQNQTTSVGDIVNRFETSGLVGSEVDEIMSTISSLTAVGTAEEISAYMEPELQSFEEKLASSKISLNKSKTLLAEKKVQLEKAQVLVERLKEVEAQLSTAEVELDAAEKELTNAGYDIQLGEIEALSQLSDLKNQINTYETNLTLAKEKSKTVEAEFEQAKTQAYAQLDDAKNKLDEASEFLINLDTAQWFVNDRNDALCGFEEYGQTCTRTAALAKIFPWFFFLVAALVCLNTMTRMVEEERTQLGTLKALGYGNQEICSKYVLYALLASAIGGIAGTFLGFALFPYAITTAYSILYDFPAVKIIYRFSYAIIGIVLAIASTVIATIIACYHSLTVVPSTLMRPKPPKNGKRVLLEKIPSLWSKFNFTTKVTLRNVFRNKKRFFMAVIGVAGCTALMVAGFGLGDSIDASLKNQFTNSDSIFEYDMQIVLNSTYDTTTEECPILSTVTGNDQISVAMLEYMKVYDTTSQSSDKRMETYICVPENTEMLNQFVRLQNRKSGEIYTLSSQGAIITEKLANELNIGVGDSIIVNVSDNYTVAVPVSAIAENYTFHYVYLSKDLYKSLFNVAPRFNYIAANLKNDLDGPERDTLAKSLMNEFEISAVAYTNQIQTSFENILNSINYVVIILIVAAGLLAFIVMYNLSNININERIREIATIKVLGFTDGEVSQYIFRENVILSVLGTFFGLFVGILLHRAIILVAEVDVVMFGRSINFTSFLYAALLSIAFSLIVNLILHRHLKKVDMVESLKSIE